MLSAPIRYDTIEEFNVDSKAEYSALSSTRSQKKKLKQTPPVRQCPFNTVMKSVRPHYEFMILFVRNFPSAAVSAATFGERPRQAADAAHLLLLAASQRRCSLDRAGALKVCLRSVEIFDWKD